MRILGPSLFLALAFFTALLADPGRPARTRGSLPPACGPSVVFGPAGAPTGGELVIGLLVSRRDETLVKDLIGEQAYRDFLAREAEYARRGEEPEEELIEVAWRDPWAANKAWKEQRDRRTALSKAFEAQHGIRLVLREVTAQECAGIPLVLVGDRELHSNEVRSLRSYIEAGGRLLRQREDVADVGEARLHLGLQGRRLTDLAKSLLLPLCAKVLETSPLIARLPSDPLAIEEIRRVDGQVVVRLASTPTEARLLRLDGDEPEPGLSQHGRELRFVFSARERDPFQHRLEAHWEGGGIRLRRSWRVVDLVGDTVLRRLLASQHAPAGGTYAARIVYSRSADGSPLAGYGEPIRIERDGQVLVSANPVSDAAGTLDVRLALPDDAAAGPATLCVGPERFPITIRRDVRLSLVTDRTLYREDDQVHVRVMVHAVPAGRPAVRQKVTLRMGRLKKDVETSQHGIASASFRLHGAKVGPKTLTAKAGGRTAEARFKVQAFEKPTFAVGLVPEKLTFDRSGAADVVLRAEYVNGAPVVGAKVTVASAMRLKLDPWDARTDSEGRALFRVKTTGRSRAGPVDFEVQDADGRRVVASLAVEIAGWKTVPRARTIDVCVVGVPCRIEVRAANRRRLRVQVDGGPERLLDLDEDGRARITATPRDETLTVSFPRVVGAKAQTFQVTVAPADRPLVVPEQRVLRVGETLHVTLLGPHGPAFVDVLRNGTVIRTFTATIRGERGRLSIPVEEDLAGRLELRAYRLDGIRPVATSAGVLVLRNRTLSVDVSAARESWRPGETARLDVRVSDRAGSPRAGVLGYWAVDRAVLELSEWSNGRETIFDLPGGGKHKRTLALAQAALEGDASARALELLGGIRLKPAGDPYTVRHDSRADGKARAAKVAEELAHANLMRLRKATLRALGRVPLAEIRVTSSLRETLLWLLARGDLDPALLRDPWGTPWTIWNRLDWRTRRGSVRNRWSAHVAFLCTSPGPDLRMNSADDLRMTWPLPHSWDEDGELIPGRVRRFLALGHKALAGNREDGQGAGDMDAPFEGPTTNGTIGIGGGAGGGFRGRGGGRDLGTGGGGRKHFGTPAPVRLRKEFPPTLCFVPEAIVGPDGKARLEIELADSITTWKTRFVASAADGAVGIGYADIRVEQPLHLDPWISRRLTRGDELELPVAVRNASADTLAVMLSLKVSDHLEIVGSASAEVSTEAGGTAAHRFRLRARKAGEARVTLTARAGELSDAVERSVHVRPDAQRLVEVANHTLAAGEAWQPALRAGAGGEVELELRPGPLTEVLRGFEGLVRKPSGCFEQTSSTLYPMLLALDYLQQTKQARPQLEDRALGLIGGGYERLLGYEVKGEPGGFSLFGSAPASAFLTAYGLMEFSDMARVYPIDPDLIPRVVKFLTKRQQKDGSFAPTRFAHQELWAEGRHPAFNCTAYTAWALAKAGQTGHASAALVWLEKHCDDVTSPYSVALAALAFLTVDADSHAGATLLGRLGEMAIPDEAGVRWASEAPTGLGCRGRTADIETTALVVQALLLSGRAAGLAERGLERLLRWRGADGRFGTTQSTILALQALLAAESGGGSSEEATVRVLLGEKQVAQQVVAAQEGAALRMRLGNVDPERLSVRIEGERRLRSTIARTSWRPWAEHRREAGRLALDVRYPSDPLAVGEPAAAVVTLHNTSNAKAGLVTAEIGVPPGCDIDPKLVKGAQAGLQRVERSEDAIVLYLLDLGAGAKKTFRIPFVPRHFLDVKTTPSTAYEYYVPHEAVIVPPQRVRAR